MRRLLMAAALVWVVGLTVGEGVVARAQEGPKKQEKKRPLLRGEQAEMAKVCGLSEEQQRQIAQLNAEMRAEQAALARKFQARVLEAMAPEQRDAWETHTLKRLLKRTYRRLEFSQEQVAKIKAARAEALEGVDAADRKAAIQAQQKWQAAIRDKILTIEQRATLDVPRILGRYRPAQLTDQQREKAKAAYVELAEGKDLTDRKVRAKLDADLRARIEKELLTDGQKLALAVVRAASPYRAAKLSADQIARIQTAYVKHMTRVKPGDRRAGYEALKKLHEEIRTQILTDAQREALKPKK